MPIPYSCHCGTDCGGVSTGCLFGHQRTNIPAGDPDYGSWLDRDGDGIACESSQSGYTPIAPLMAQPRPFTMYISWLGTDCILVRYPDGNATPEQNICNPEDHGIWLDHNATHGQLIGADPVMGNAEAIGCRVVADDTDVRLMEDFASAGDGHDVNCIMTAAWIPIPQCQGETDCAVPYFCRLVRIDLCRSTAGFRSLVWLFAIRGAPVVGDIAVVGSCRFGEAGPRWVTIQAPTRCFTNTTEATLVQGYCHTTTVICRGAGERPALRHCESQ
jgi:hypothetical protein